jgi:hypothetical protein
MATLHLFTHTNRPHSIAHTLLATPTNNGRYADRYADDLGRRYGDGPGDWDAYGAGADYHEPDHADNGGQPRHLLASDEPDNVAGVGGGGGGQRRHLLASIGRQLTSQPVTAHDKPASHSVGHDTTGQKLRSHKASIRGHKGGTTTRPHSNAQFITHAGAVPTTTAPRDAKAGSHPMLHGHARPHHHQHGGVADTTTVQPVAHQHDRLHAATRKDEHQPATTSALLPATTTPYWGRHGRHSRYNHDALHGHHRGQTTVVADRADANQPDADLAVTNQPDGDRAKAAAAAHQADETVANATADSYNDDEVVVGGNRTNSTNSTNGTVVELARPRRHNYTIAFWPVSRVGEARNLTVFDLPEVVKGGASEAKTDADVGEEDEKISSSRFQDNSELQCVLSSRPFLLCFVTR